MHIREKIIFVLSFFILVSAAVCDSTSSDNGGGGGGGSSSNTFTVTYDGNGNTGGTVPVDTNEYETGDTVTVPIMIYGFFTKTGYRMNDWNTELDGSGETYGSGDTFVMGTENVTLYAQWLAFEYMDDFIINQTGFYSATGLNNSIYYAAYGNDSTVLEVQLMEYNLTYNAATPRSMTGNNVCACGFGSELVAANNKLYYFANDGASYNPGTDSWGTLSFPNRRGEAGVAVSGNDIYYIGGRGDLNTGVVYHTQTDTWDTIANCPYGTDCPAAVSADGKIYLLGGEAYPNKMAFYDISSNIWTSLDDIPFTSVSSSPTARVYKGKILFFSWLTMYLFDIASSTWDTASVELPQAGIPVIVGTTLYLLSYNETKGGVDVYKYIGF